MLQGISKMESARAIQTFAIVFSTSVKDLLVGMSGTLRNERKPLSMQKFVLRKCSGVSQTQWMLEFQTFAIVFSTPENLLSRDFGALGIKESYFLRKKKFWENAVGYLRNVECQSFLTLAIVFNTPDNLLVGIFGALEWKKAIFWAKTCFEKMQ